jgi:hypothetical protein
MNVADVSVLIITMMWLGLALIQHLLGTTEAGGTATFTVVLNSKPTADVTIGLSSSRTAEGTVSPTSIVFNSSNWNTAQTVTITGVNDYVDDGDQPYTIVTANASSTDTKYNNLNVADVSVTNQDNDAAGIIVSPTAWINHNSREAKEERQFLV